MPGAPSACGTSSAWLRRGVTLSSFCFPQNVAEYDLKDVSYKVRSPTCHELTVLGSSDEPMVFNFEEEREAQKWWTIVSSSLREVQKGQCRQAAARGLAGTRGLCLRPRGAARLSPAPAADVPSGETRLGLVLPGNNSGVRYQLLLAPRVPGQHLGLLLLRGVNSCTPGEGCSEGSCVRWSIRGSREEAPGDRRWRGQ